MRKLDYVFANLRQVTAYDALGPNSNTYAHQLLKLAGYSVPSPPDGMAWDYDAAFRYGGKFFTAWGQPLWPAYANATTLGFFGRGYNIGEWIKGR